MYTSKYSNFSYMGAPANADFAPAWWDAGVDAVKGAGSNLNEMAKSRARQDIGKLKAYSEKVAAKKAAQNAPKALPPGPSPVNPMMIAPAPGSSAARTYQQGLNSPAGNRLPLPPPSAPGAAPTPNVPGAPRALPPGAPQPVPQVPKGPYRPPQPLEPLSDVWDDVPKANPAVKAAPAPSAAPENAAPNASPPPPSASSENPAKRRYRLEGAAKGAAIGAGVGAAGLGIGRLINRNKEEEQNFSFLGNLVNF
jgi:hypothetical protein